MTLQHQQQQIPPNSIKLEEEIETGLEFIINHFDSTILYFPRTIMTKKLGYQKEVYSKKDAMEYFQQSDYLDCRINAFRSSNSAEQQQWNPDLIFIDIDKNNFKNEKNFEVALSTTLENIREKLNGYPSVLKSGNGYHIIQPIEAIAFENYSGNDNDTLFFIKNEFGNDFNLFNEFLRFVKDFLSDNKADKNNNPSLKSCLLRIPGSINSKNNTKIAIVQKWNGYRPVITEDFLEYFVDYLIQKKIKQEYNQIQKLNTKSGINKNNYTIMNG